MSGKLPIALVTILVMTAWPSAQERHTHPASKDAPALGSVSFANSGNAASQEPFLRGLALLHSFEYQKKPPRHFAPPNGPTPRLPCRIGARR